MPPKGQAVVLRSIDGTDTLMDSAGHPMVAIVSGDMHVRLWDGARTITLDPVASAVPVVDTLHQRTHEGDTYHYSNIFIDVADDASADFLVKVGANKDLHSTFAGEAGGDSYPYLLRSPTVSSNGFEVSPVNKNSNYSNNSDAQIFINPVVTASGDILYQSYIPGGSGPKTFGGSAEERDEWVLKKSTDYLVRMTNVAGSAKIMSMRMTYYEKS